MVGFDDFYKIIPEYRFNIQVGRLSKNGDTGDLHYGGSKPEYSDNDVLQDMMYCKPLKNKPVGSIKKERMKDSQARYINVLPGSGGSNHQRLIFFHRKWILN